MLPALPSPLLAFSSSRLANVVSERKGMIMEELSTKAPVTVDEDPIAGKHYMAITDETGDTKIMWSKDNEDEVENARRSFKDFLKKGYKAFSVVGKKGETGEQMDEFDPDAERIIFTKPQRGG
jgi:hypothetical protein